MARRFIPARLRLLLRRAAVWGGSSLALGIAVLVIALLIPGCTAGYVTRQSITHLHVLAARQPVERMLDEDAVPEEWRAKIAIIQDARAFGVETLDLPASDLYRTISLVHPDPNWIVTASPRDALRPVTWWFPAAGRVAYRGYYSRAGAGRFADRLRRRRLDVLVRPSDAFSTLGWFADPIRPAMMDRSEASLVDLVLHEATHRVVYFKGQTDFNESFASFVGETGTLLYLAARHGAGCDLCRRTAAAYADEETFGAFIADLVTRLEDLYSRPISSEEKIRRRQAIFDAARQRSRTLPWQGHGHDGFAHASLDNAVILSLRRYGKDRDLFSRVLSACDGDLARSIHTVRNLGWSDLSRRQKRSGDPFTLLRDRLATADKCSSPAA
ncbi:MAG: aminopeptidase [Acidobacteriota bacterium]